MNVAHENAGAFGKEYLKTYYPSEFDLKNFYSAIQIVHLLRNKPLIDIKDLDKSSQLASEVIENAAILDFLIDIWKRCYESSSSGELIVLDIGGGPTVYQHIPASLHATAIIHAEYLKENQREVQMFLQKESGAHNWDAYFDVVRTMLSREEAYQSLLDVFSTSTDDVVRKKAKQIKTILADSSGELLQKEVRAKIHSVVSCDIFNKSLDCSSTSDLTNAINEVRSSGQVEVVSCFFVPESVATDKQHWESSMENITNRIKPGGHLIMMAIRNAEWYASGESRIKAYPIDEQAIEEYLAKIKFHIKEIKILLGSNKEPHGYDGMLFVFAQKLV